jgi:hypothetical protein
VEHPRVVVVITHEALHPQALFVVLVAQALGRLGLQVAGEHVVAVPGQEVELVAHAPQKREGGIGRLLLALGDQALLPELAQRAGPELGRAEPQRGVHVSQPARRLLDVGLHDVGRGPVLAIALVPLGQGGGQELLEVPAVHVGPQHSTEAGEEPPVAGQETSRLHGGPARQIGGRHGQAVLQRAQAVADLEPQVPQGVEQLLGDALNVGAELAVVDHHEVDVRRRVELAPTVAAQSHQRRRRRGQAGGHRVGRDEPGQGADDLVDQARVGPH